MLSSVITAVGRAHVRQRTALARLAVACLVAGSALAAAYGGDHANANGEPRLFTIRGAPSGDFAGKPPRALVIMAHGGGWVGVGPRLVRDLQSVAQVLNASGYETLNVDYRPGIRSFDDVARFFDRERKRLRGRIPICLLGASAGGHISLMVAMRRPQVDCVIALAAPVDLVDLQRPETPAVLRDVIQQTFGARDLSAWSPARRRGRIRQPILYVIAVNDPAVPQSHAQLLARAQPRVQVMTLAAGDRPFVHSNIDAGDLLRVGRRMIRFVGARRAKR